MHPSDKPSLSSAPSESPSNTPSETCDEGAAGTEIATYGFSNLVGFTLTSSDSNGGAAEDPWTANSNNGGCTGKGVLAGKTTGGGGGVNDETSLSIDAPVGTDRMTFVYSHPPINDAYTFQILIDGVVVRDYSSSGDDVSCEPECIFITEGQTVTFYCASTSTSEAWTCALDDLTFWPAVVRRSLEQSYHVDVDFEDQMVNSDKKDDYSEATYPFPEEEEVTQSQENFEPYIRDSQNYWTDSSASRTRAMVFVALFVCHILLYIFAT